MYFLKPLASIQQNAIIRMPRTALGYDSHYLDHTCRRAVNVKLAVYLRFKSASDVCNFDFEISDLIFPYEKCNNPYKNVH
jgi:hypothetical protein